MKRVVAPLVFVLIVLFLFFPIFAGGKIFGNHFVFYTHYPLFKFFGDSLRYSGELTTWVSPYLSGFPAYLSQQGGFLSPVTILFFIFFDFLTAYHALIVLNFIFSGMVTYTLARNLMLSKYASVVAALTYTFSHFVVSNSQFLLWSNLFPFLPLFFVILLKIHKGGKTYLFGFLGTLILTIALLSAVIEVVLFTVLAGFFFTLFLAWQARCFRALRVFLVISVFSAVFASPWLLPVFNYTGLLPRAEGLSAAETFSGAVQIGDILRVFYPYFGIPYLPVGFSGDFVFLYVGVLPLIFGGLSFFLVRKERFFGFFLFLFLTTFSLTLSFLPFFGWLHRLPFFGLVRGPFKWLPLAIFSWAILAGYGFNFLEQIKLQKNFDRFSRVLENFVLFLTVSAIAINIVFLFFKDRLIGLVRYYFDHYLFPKGVLANTWIYYQEKMNENIGNYFYNISFKNYHFSVSVFFIAAAGVLFFLYRRGVLSTDRFKKYAAGAVILNTILIWQGFYKWESRDIIENTPASAIFLQNRQYESEPFRVFSFFPDFSLYHGSFGITERDKQSQMSLNTVLLFPNTNIFYHIDSVAAEENFMTKRQEKLLIKVGFEHKDFNESGANLTDPLRPLSQKISLFTSPRNLSLLSMLNVKYLLSSFELPLPLTKVFETKATKYNIPVYIYENPDVLPRVYFAKTPVYTKETNEDKLFEELLKIDNFKEKTLIECSEPICQAKTETSTNDNSQITIKELKNGYLKLETKTDSPRWLIYSESNLPTWQATIDNQPTRIYTANYIYQAIFMPEGEWEVEIAYPDFWRQYIYSLKNLLMNKTFK